MVPFVVKAGVVELRIEVELIGIGRRPVVVLASDIVEMFETGPKVENLALVVIGRDEL